MSAYGKIKSERFCEIVGGFVALTGQFCEILDNTNITLLSIVREVKISKCVHTSGITNFTHIIRICIKSTSIITAPSVSFHHHFIIIIYLF